MGNLKRTTLRINNIKKKRNLTKRKMNKNRTRRRYYNGGMPVRTTKDDKNTIEYCSICFDPLREEDFIHFIQFTCGHQFHLECIKQWIEIKPTCPMCRVGFTYNEKMFIGMTFKLGDNLSIHINGDNTIFSEKNYFTKLIKDKVIEYLSINDAIKHIKFENLPFNLPFEEKINADGSYRAPDNFIIKFADFIASRPDLKSLTFRNCNLEGTDFKILVDALLFNKDNKLETLMIQGNNMLGISISISIIPNVLVDEDGEPIYLYQVLYEVDKSVVDNLVRLINEKKHKISQIFLGNNVIQSTEITRLGGKLNQKTLQYLDRSIETQQIVNPNYKSKELYEKEVAEQEVKELLQKKAEEEEAAAAEARKSFIERMVNKYVTPRISESLSNVSNSVKSRLPKLPESLSRFFGSKQTGGKNRKKRYSRKVK